MSLGDREKDRDNMLQEEYAFSLSSEPSGV
jgi:hypothetical protein